MLNKSSLLPLSLLPYPYPNFQVGDDVQQDLGGGAVELGMERILGECE